MKKLTQCILAVSLLASQIAPCMAADLKVGVVDVRAVVSQSKETQAINEKLKKDFQSRENEIMALDKTLKEKSDKLQRNAAIMGEAERSKLERDIVADKRNLQRMQQEYREDGQIAQRQEMDKLFVKVKASIARVAKAEKFDLVLHNEAVPFSSDQLDITQVVLKDLEKG